MTISVTHSIAIIAVAAVCTMATRWAPFLLFGGKRRTPECVEYLGRALPAAIIAVLVVYCLKSVSFAAPAGWAPQLIAVAVVVLLHVLRGNTLLSIAGGTACYMLLIRTVFSVL
jgi:branched-subunit amino acid transport protein AzlD